MNKFLKRAGVVARKALRGMLAVLLSMVLLGALGAGAQQVTPSIPAPPSAKAPSAEFLKAADEVLVEMSKLLSLPMLSPLKKSVRPRQEIRDYVVRRMAEDKNPQKRYADRLALEKFGLIPKGFQIEPFLIDLLTEQIAGLYDPKSQEFYIADWISPADQRMVMAHELTHALQDQHYHVDAWLEAAKPNDDAELARDAVLEGSALAAMVDYMLRKQQKGIRDLPDLDASLLLGEIDSSPQLAKAPPFLRNSLLFPYLAGTRFTQQFLRAHSGWADFRQVFEYPPASTQQILHPELYLEGVPPPPPVTLPDSSRVLPAGWKKLDENVFGEFALQELLKQFLGKERASRLAPAWAGDRYAIFEHEKTKKVLLVVRLRMTSEAAAARFFGNYSEALELKYQKRTTLFRRPNFFSFETPGGGVFLRCYADQCLTLEGTTRAVFDKINRALGWPAVPKRLEPLKTAPKSEVTRTSPLVPLHGAR